MVVTPGVAERALESFFVHDDADNFGRRRRRREGKPLNLAITSSLSAICLTCFGETKLTASMCLKPRPAAAFKYSTLIFVWE